MGFLGIIFSLTVLTGCATTTTQINYKTDSPKQNSKGIDVSVLSVVDNRPVSERDVLGRVMNGLGMKVGDIKSPPDLLEKIKKSLESELENAGYTISAQDKSLVLKTSLESLSCFFKDKTEASIRIRFIVTDHGQEVLNHVYGGEGEHHPLWGEHDPAIINSIKAAFNEFLKDFDQYTKS